MANFDYDLGIIGGGAAGLTTASGAAQLGAKVLLIEKEPRLGGDCLHYGCVPSKTLINSARVYHLMKSGPEFGLPAIEPPPVDFRDIAGRIAGVITEIQKHDSVERFCGLGARVEFGSASFADEHCVDLGGRRFSAASWLVATGSSPAAPPVPGLGEVPYLTNRDIFSLDRLPDSLIILGAGPIAIEMAQAFRRLGSRVTVIQRSGQILSREDQDMANIIQACLEAEGVVFKLGVAIERAESAGAIRRVIVEDHGVEQAVEGDAILVALGRVANVDGLGLDRAGVKYSPKGIDVDSRLRTSQKHIFAAGDVTGKYQFTHAAGYEGGVVLANAVFHLPRRADYNRLPWCTYTDPELASLGLNEKAAQEAGIEYEVWTERFEANDRALAQGRGQGMIKMLVNEKEKPIGVQIAGPHAGELINEWVAVMGGNVGLATLASAIHPYPTLGEINKRVAADLLQPKLFSPRIQKGLKLLFHLKGRACPAQED